MSPEACSYFFLKRSSLTKTYVFALDAHCNRSSRHVISAPPLEAAATALDSIISDSSTKTSSGNTKVKQWQQQEQILHAKVLPLQLLMWDLWVPLSAAPTKQRQHKRQAVTSDSISSDSISSDSSTNQAAATQMASSDIGQH
jgi:hypothetical protein